MSRVDDRDRVLFDLRALSNAWAPVPPSAVTDSGRLHPPFHDLPAGSYTLCASCAATPINRRCDGCPRITSAIYRRITAERQPSWWRRLFRKRGSR